MRARNFGKPEKGVSMVEYSLLVSFVAIFVVFAVSNLGAQTQGMADRVVAVIKTVEAMGPTDERAP